MAATPLTKTVLTRNLTQQTNYHSTRLNLSANSTNNHIISHNVSNIHNQSSFHQDSDAHQQIHERDRSVLPKQFSTPVKNKRSNKSQSMLLNNTSAICNELMNEIDDSYNDSCHNDEFESPFLDDNESIIKKDIPEQPDILTTIKSTLQKYLPASTNPEKILKNSEKFPSQEYVRSVKWHPQCLSLESDNLENYDNFLPGYSENKFCGKPRVAICLSNNQVEIHHTSDYSLSLDSDDKSLPPIVLRHRLQEDLIGCAWKPFCVNTLAVISCKHGILFWHKLGRHDMKSIATVQSVTNQNQQIKLVPSTNAHLVWSPPQWFKNPKSGIDSVEKSCDIEFTRSGNSLCILWYGSIFVLKPNEYSELNSGFQSNVIARIDDVRSPFLLNPTENVGLFIAGGEAKQDLYIFDANRKGKFLSDLLDRSWNIWNETILTKAHKKIKGFKMAGGCWWETSNLRKRPDTIEGIFLAFYENSSKIMQVQVNHPNIESDPDNPNPSDNYIITNKKAFDINDNIAGDNSYFHAADPDDTLNVMKQNSGFVTSIVWKNDICCVAHGDRGLITVYRARVNAGGCAFQKMQTLENKYNERVKNLTLFQGRVLAATFECGIFDYMKLKQF